MNGEAQILVRQRQTQLAELGGLDAYQRSCLQHLKIRTAIKVTVYDDEHLGDFVSLVVQYEHKATGHIKGGELNTCTWLNSSNLLTSHPHGDAILAAGGEDGTIVLISIAEAQVVKQLLGHSKGVVELCSCPGRPRLLLSLAKDAQVKLWDVVSGACLTTLETDAFSIALDPTGSHFVTGNRNGRMHTYAIAAVPGSDGALQLTSQPAKEQLRPHGDNPNDALCCLRYVGNHLVARTNDGHMYAWEQPSMKQSSSWRVPGCSKEVQATWATRTAFGSTPDGGYVCSGNSNGDVYVYHVATGTQAGHVKPVRVTAPVRACGLSHDCRHLLAVLGNGYLFRYENEQQAGPVASAAPAPAAVLPRAAGVAAPNPTAATGDCPMETGDSCRRNGEVAQCTAAVPSPDDDCKDEDMADVDGDAAAGGVRHIKAKSRRSSNTKQHKGDDSDSDFGKKKRRGGRQAGRGRGGKATTVAGARAGSLAAITDSGQVAAADTDAVADVGEGDAMVDDV